nr:MerR family transcriptional regulator [Microbacterium bovistercoris]
MAKPDSSTPLYGIAVAAQLVDLPEPTLRLLESKGLLNPSRTAGGTRRYSEDDVARLRRIADLRDDGVNVEGIRRILHLQDENQELRDTMGSD